MVRDALRDNCLTVWEVFAILNFVIHFFFHLWMMYKPQWLVFQLKQTLTADSISKDGLGEFIKVKSYKNQYV